MKIYTKTGDKGQTQIYADEMVRMHKNADVLECYGSLDELNAHVGLLICELKQEDLVAPVSLLQDIQKNLFQIGFAISASTKITDTDLDVLEQAIDNMQSALPAQTHFILPGGHKVSAQTHVCRTVARRAERRMVALMNDYPVPELCLSYLNRLSDYLFVVARWVNHQTGEAEASV